MLRFALGGGVHRWLPMSTFPYGTLVVNVLGCLAVGVLSRLHTAKILRLSTDLPIVVEIVDTKERIDAFLPVIDGAIQEGLATLEKVEIRLYRAGAATTPS